jgi:hypothetical protein
MLLVCCATLCATAAQAGTISTPVALELALTVDVSGTIDDTEFEMQKQAYAAAFRDPDVIASIESMGGIAVTLIYWADGKAERPDGLGWAFVDGAASANTFADAIAATDRVFAGNVTGGLTSVAHALTFATSELLNNDFDGQRLVIDISGDGSENFEQEPAIPAKLPDLTLEFVVDEGILQLTIEEILLPDWGAVQEARDDALAEGIVINGLPIRPKLFDPPMDGNEQTETFDASPALDFFDPAPIVPGLTPEQQAELDAAYLAHLLMAIGDPGTTFHGWFYRDFVTGGPGAFLEFADTFEDVERAIHAKLLAELPEPGSLCLLALALLAIGGAQAARIL